MMNKTAVLLAVIGLISAMGGAKSMDAMFNNVSRIVSKCEKGRIRLSVVTRRDSASGGEVVHLHFSGKGRIRAYETKRLDITAQHKVVVMLKGNPENAGVKVFLLVVISRNNTLTTHLSGQLQVTDKGWKKYVFGLDSDFGLGDASYVMTGIGVVIDNTGSGNQGGDIAIDGLRVIQSGDLGVSQSAFQVGTSVGRPKTRYILPKIRVFADLDNGDFRSINIHRRKIIREDDTDANLSYCDLLTQPVSDTILNQPRLNDNTDVIVFARSTFEFQARFEGMTLNRRSFQPGEILEITYYWRNLSARKIDPRDIPGQSFIVGRGPKRCSVHFMNPKSTKPFHIEINGDHDLPVAIHDWEPGRLLKDGPYRLTIPRDAATGRYSVRLGGWFLHQKGKHRLVFKDVIQVGGKGRLPPNKVIIDPVRLRQKVTIDDRVALTLKAVERGKGMLLFGRIIPSYGELAPVTILREAASTAVERMRIRIIRSDHPLFAGASLRPVTLGKYLQCAPNPGADVLAAWEDGTPAIVEKKTGKGRVLYFAFGLGQDVVRSKVFYDELFIRALYYLSGHGTVNARLAYLGRLMTSGRRLHDLRLIDEILNSGKTGGARTIAALARRHARLVSLFNRGSDISPRAVRGLLVAITHAEERFAYRGNQRFYVGASRNNFGRLGWGVDDGWLVHSRNRNLECMVRDRASYALGFSLHEKIDLAGRWRFQKDPDRRGAKRGFADPTYDDSQWMTMKVPGFWEQTIGDYDGIAWYRRRFEVPIEWRGKPLLLRVKGIDDLDHTYFNGHLIGTTGRDTMEFWIHERKYAVMPGIVRYGKENTLVIRVNDLHGSGGFIRQPELELVKPSRQNQRKEIDVRHVDWVSKTSVLRIDDRKLAIIDTLLFPGAMYETRAKRLVLMADKLSHVAYNGNKGIRMVKLRAADPVYAKNTAGRLGENWLLLWRDTEPANPPLLVVLQRNPDAIRCKTIAGIPKALTFERAAGIGRLVIAYPFGMQIRFDLANWEERLPAEVISRCREFSRVAALLPVGCDELYAIDDRERTVTVIDRFRYRALQDDWNTTPRKMVFLPPLVSYCRGRIPGLVSRVKPGETSMHVPTKYGFLQGAANNDMIEYRVTLPEYHTSIPVNVADDTALTDLINQHFQAGSKWSCGGGVPENAWDFRLKYCDMHAFLMGLMEALLGREYLDKPRKQRLFERVSFRLQKALELYQYKCVVRYREEPFSRLRYLITFDSFYKNPTLYKSGVGSRLIYGDANESSTLLPSVAYLYALHYGQWDFIKSNWKYLKEAMKLMFVSDDWAYMSTGCREFGAGAWIDMLNCEYPGIMAYAKLAREIGDRQEYHHALYRAARRMPPTLARLWFAEYVNTYYNREEQVRIVSGFSETGVKAFTDRLSKNYLLGGHVLFDTSQGTYKELDLLYRRYAGDRIGWYLKRLFLPSLVEKRLPVSFGALRNLAAWRILPFEELKRHALSYSVSQDHWQKDWPGMRQCDQVGTLITNRYPQVQLRDWKPARLVNSRFSPKKNLLTLIFDNTVSESKSWCIRLRSCLAPVKVVINGHEYARMESRTARTPGAGWTYDMTTGILSLPLAVKGEIHITVHFKKE